MCLRSAGATVVRPEATLLYLRRRHVHVLAAVDRAHGLMGDGVIARTTDRPPVRETELSPVTLLTQNYNTSTIPGTTTLKDKRYSEYIYDNNRKNYDSHPAVSGSSLSARIQYNSTIHELIEDLMRLLKNAICLPDGLPPDTR